MAQVAHIEVNDQPVDLADGLEAGCYVAQVVASLADIGDQSVLFATAAVAPTDDADYFRAGYGRFFTFTAGGGTSPTWAKTSVMGLAVPVALARTT